MLIERRIDRVSLFKSQPKLRIRDRNDIYELVKTDKDLKTNEIVLFYSFIDAFPCPDSD